MDNDGDSHDNIKCLERVKKLTLLASNSFHYLNVSNQWNIPSNYNNGMAKEKGPCDNCGGKKYAPDFPHPRDEANIKNDKEERADCRGGGGYGSGSDGRRQGGRNKWINDNKDRDINDYGNDVQKRVNAWMCYCRCK